MEKIHTSRGCYKDHTKYGPWKRFKICKLLLSFNYKACLVGQERQSTLKNKIQIDLKQRKTKTSRKQETMSGIKPWHTFHV